MSDHNRSEGSVSLADAAAWMQAWSEKISMDTLVITGGEPTLNPDLFEIIKSARSHWPDAHIKLMTNGEHFAKVDPIAVLKEVGNATLWISCHWSFGPSFDLLQKQTHDLINSYGKWTNKHPQVVDSVYLDMEQDSVSVKMAVYGEFVRTYHGTGILIRPWNSKNPTAAHSICSSPSNPQLYKNRLYKCSPIANLKDTLELQGLLDNAHWQDYLSYKGYGVDDDIGSFVQDIGKPNTKICGMCTDAKPLAVVPHYEMANVVRKD
jgi:hypothetical protein